MATDTWFPSIQDEYLIYRVPFWYYPLNDPIERRKNIHSKMESDFVIGRTVNPVCGLHRSIYYLWWCARSKRRGTRILVAPHRPNESLFEHSCALSSVLVPLDLVWNLVTLQFLSMKQLNPRWGFLLAVI